MRVLFAAFVLTAMFVGMIGCKHDDNGYDSSDRRDKQDRLDTVRGKTPSN